MPFKGSSRIVYLITAMLISTSSVNAAEIKVMSVNALKEVLRELVPVFERDSGNNVTFIWGGTESLSKKVAAGEAADIVILARANVDKLIQDGKLAAGSPTDLVKSGIGIAVRSGLPKPDVSSAEAVKKAVLAARSVGYSSGPSGFYMADLFRQMGIADQIKNKVKQPESGVQIGDLMDRGEIDLGFQQISELLHVNGIDFLGPLPDEIQKVTVFAAALHPAAGAPGEVVRLLKFLTGPDALPIIKKNGFEPG